MNVIIDGVQYVPAKEVLLKPNIFMKKLLAQFWGDDFLINLSLEEIQKRMDGLRVWVSDMVPPDSGQDIGEFYRSLFEE